MTAKMGKRNCRLTKGKDSKNKILNYSNIFSYVYKLLFNYSVIKNIALNFILWN